MNSQQQIVRFEESSRRSAGLESLEKTILKKRFRPDRSARPAAGRFPSGEEEPNVYANGNESLEEKHVSAKQSEERLASEPRGSGTSQARSNRGARRSRPGKISFLGSRGRSCS